MSIKKKQTGRKDRQGPRSGKDAGKGSTEILYGFHSVYEALKAGRRTFQTLYISQTRSPGRGRKVTDLANEKGIRVETVPLEKLDKLANGANHQGVAARTGLLPVEKAGQAGSLVSKTDGSCFVLVLENIEDPHNLGALIRTAVCCGVDYIFYPKDRSAPPSAAVSRSSAGAMEHARMFVMTNTASVLRSLKDAGFWISGLDADGSKALFEADLTGNIALVIGGEHKGIRPGVRKECDFLLSIPNKGRINSLNASVAGGMAMYEALRQRG